MTWMYMEPAPLRPLGCSTDNTRTRFLACCHVVARGEDLLMSTVPGDQISLSTRATIASMRESDMLSGPDVLVA